MQTQAKLIFTINFLFLTIIIIGNVFYASAQTLMGTINNYTTVTDITSNNLTVTSSAGFASGNTVLIIQMQGATVDQTNTSAFGNVINYNGAGNYEFGVIAGINGNNVTLKSPLCKTYSITGSVQMVWVPVYNNLTITGILTCPPWNGASGAIVALKVTGTLTLNADIDASGTGFNGGTAKTGNGGFGCNNKNYYLNYTANQGGEKGESIAAYVIGFDGGRGKWAAGGGGGQPGNSGGGGGGNANAGGLGGFEFNGCGPTGIQGFGGQALAYSNGIAFMGSGGGGGFADNGQPVTPGTNGGGIIILDAKTIVGNGNTIRSDGLNQTGISNDESAGGGGAGGCIILNTQTFTSNLNVELNGGNGGNVYNYLFPDSCHGPGGGGGTGMLFISQPTLPTNVTLIANGGVPGVLQNPASSCYNTPFGATVGSGTPATSVTYNLVLPTPIDPISLGNDTSICQNTSFQLNAHSGYVSYVWQDGSTDSIFTVKDTGSYHVKVTNVNGCTAGDTVKVSFYPTFTVSAGNDTDICAGQSVLLNAGSGFSKYLWQDASSNPTLLVSEGGTYTVSVTNSEGCSASDAVTVTQHPLPIVNLGNDTSICPGTFITLDAGAGYVSYLWQDSSTGQTSIAAQPATYSVRIENNFNCWGSDSLTILSFLNKPPSNLVSDTTVCPGIPIILNAPSGYDLYLWDTTYYSNQLSVSEPGIHLLTVTNDEGCSNSDTIVVGKYCPPTLYFPNAFSPNNDGIDDIFKPFAVNINTYDLKIYDRWGELVFESSQLNYGWDGTFNSKNCSVGTYVYFATYVGSADGRTSSGVVKGNVTLIR